MSRPRIFLVLLGIVLIVIGLAIAALVDRSLGLGLPVGLGLFIVGAFLMIMPFLGVHDRED